MKTSVPPLTEWTQRPFKTNIRYTPFISSHSLRILCPQLSPQHTYRPGAHSLLDSPHHTHTPPPPTPKSGLVLGLTAQAWLSVSLNEKFNFLAIIDLVSVLHSTGNDLWPDCMMCIDPRLFILLYSLYFPLASEPESVDSLSDNQSTVFSSTCRSQP